jgi:hypothetical protein
MQHAPSKGHSPAYLRCEVTDVQCLTLNWQEDISDTRPRDHLLSIRSYYSTLHIVIFYLIYIFMLVLAIDVVYTYFNSIDLNNRQKLLTHIHRIC